MTDRNRVFRTLVDHFFRRFFDNDTVQVEGDTLTTLARALAIVAVPGMMVAFFLQNSYPRKSPWLAMEDQYFFILLSFVVMAAVSIFEWEMLFPDRLDFLVLSPLPLRPVQMLAAKAAALVGFLTLFLIACNAFGIVMLPAVSKGDFFRQIYAHAAAVLLAGTFAALLVLALGGVLLCVLDPAHFRIASPALQMLSVMVLTLLLLQYFSGGAIQLFRSQSNGIARWMPPFWFLGIYQHLLLGPAAPAFASAMARRAVGATAIVAVVVLLTYPLAWVRMRRLALEGSLRKRRQPNRWLGWVIHKLVRKPGERAVFHFIGQSIARNNRYQVYLAMYSGTGLAVALACAVSLRATDVKLHPVLSSVGLHAVLPLLLFWTLAGLRLAFAFPLNLSAGWIFRITGVNPADCASAARKWVFISASALILTMLGLLILAHWRLRDLLIQLVCGLCIALLLTDGFFFSQSSVPFNQPRMPGKTSFPLMLTLYVGVFPMFVYSMVQMEMRLEKNLPKLLLLALMAAAIHAAVNVLRGGSEEVEEEMEGYEGEFQLLGLS
jgi:hypothetical protein